MDPREARALIERLERDAERIASRFGLRYRSLEPERPNVRSRYGVHVLIVDRRIEGRQLPFEAVHKNIAKYLEDRVWRQAVRQYIELLIGSADIKGIDLKGSVSPLVQ